VTTNSWAFEAFNAKKMSPVELALSFVAPPSFSTLVGADHCYILGPRGSGKTTLLRMLQGESLMARSDARAARLRDLIPYSAVFVPADELWASQASPEASRVAFCAQMLYALVETMIYRTQRIDAYENPVHLPADMSSAEEVVLARECAEAWGVSPSATGLYRLLSALDLKMLAIQTVTPGPRDPMVQADAMSLFAFGVRAFNRAARQPGHRWALLLDEMEIAPKEVHDQVVSFVRGGSTTVIVKASMSPFDRYGSSFGVQGSPIPGHDFQPIYLADMKAGDVRRFTAGLWDGVLESHGLPAVSMEHALGRSAIEIPGGSSQTTDTEVRRVLRRAQSSDPGFARWLKERNISPNRLQEMTYNERSATIRKVYPLLVFRDSVTTVRNGRVVRRSRKKDLEPFTGARAVTLALEGNPRWAKTAFTQMLAGFDDRSNTIERGAQFDALSSLAERFEGLLRVLPRRHAHPSTLPVATIVDLVAAYFNAQNTGPFVSDPKNCFIVDQDAGTELIDAMILGLYAGAFVHIRDRRSEALISDFRGNRFRLAYLLGVRDRREFPLRRGKDVRLGVVLDEARGRGRLSDPPSEQLGLEF